MKEKLIWIKTFAWIIGIICGLNVIYISFWLLFSLLSIANLTAILNHFGASSLKEFYLSSIKGLSINAIGLISAISILNFKEWGRKLFILIHLFWIGNTFFYWFKNGWISFYYGWHVGCLLILWSLLILFYFTRPKIKKYFNK